MPHCSCTRFARTVLCIAILSAAGYAQSPAPGPQLQYASLTGAANTIVATRVPVVTSTGQTVYTDMVLQFSSDDSGNLYVNAGYPTLNPSPMLLSSSFQSGNYVGPHNAANGKANIAISGPGVSNGGSNTWTAASTGGSDPCTYPASATWYVGDPNNNPMAARLTKAKITSTAWTFGVAGSGIAFSCGGSLSFAWGSGAIVGVSQVGNTITFASFTNNSFDQASPVDQVTYTISQ